jgi:hypothetical protein
VKEGHIPIIESDSVYGCKILGLGFLKGDSLKGIIV